MRRVTHRGGTVPLPPPKNATAVARKSTAGKGFKSGFCSCGIPERFLTLRGCYYHRHRGFTLPLSLEVIDEAAARSIWSYDCFLLLIQLVFVPFVAISAFEREQAEPWF